MRHRIQSYQNLIFHQRMATIEEIRSKSEEYVQWDPVESTRKEIATLIKEERWEDLRQRIMNRLVFGTAGMNSDEI